MYQGISRSLANLAVTSLGIVKVAQAPQSTLGLRCAKHRGGLCRCNGSNSQYSKDSSRCHLRVDTKKKPLHVQVDIHIHQTASTKIKFKADIISRRISPWDRKFRFYGLDVSQLSTLDHLFQTVKHRVKPENVHPLM